jgi:hypothetical protein
MLDHFADPVRSILRIAEREADRLGHNYIGCEHVLAALAQQPETPTTRILAGYGLTLDAIRTHLDRLVEQGVLPPPWHNDADLLRGLGIELDAVLRAARESFGDAAVDNAARRVTRRTGWTPLCGKAILIKQALYYAGEQRRERNGPVIEAPDFLLGLLRDAQQPIDKPRCFNNPWRRRLRGRLGLPLRGPSPVRLIVEAAGTSLEALQQAVTAGVPFTT